MQRPIKAKLKLSNIAARMLIIIHWIRSVGGLPAAVVCAVEAMRRCLLTSSQCTISGRRSQVQTAHADPDITELV